MSDNAYDYLYSRDARQIHNHRKELQCMLDRLNGLGYAGHAAEATERILRFVEDLNRKLDHEITPQLSALQAVWLAVQSWDSNKGSEEALKAALAVFSAPERPAETVHGELDECNAAVIDGNSYLFFTIGPANTRRTGIMVGIGSSKPARRDLFRICLKHAPQMILAVAGQTVVTLTAGEADARGVRIVHTIKIEEQ